MQENKQELKLELKHSELILLNHLYLDKDYPFGFLTLRDAAKFLNVSPATMINIIKNLEKKNYILKVKDFVVFIYPVENNELRRLVLKKMGWIRE